MMILCSIKWKVNIINLSIRDWKDKEIWIHNFIVEIIDLRNNIQ